MTLERLTTIINRTVGDIVGPIIVQRLAAQLFAELLQEQSKHTERLDGMIEKLEQSVDVRYGC
jgi:hypothetical protein